MHDTIQIIIELLKVIMLLFLVPAQFAWGMITSGSGPQVLVGLLILGSVYGSMALATMRGIFWFTVRRHQPARRPQRRRRTRRVAP